MKNLNMIDSVEVLRLEKAVCISAKFLQKWVKNAGWSKKSLIRHTLETQRGLIDDHNTLLVEILSIGGVKE